MGMVRLPPIIIPFVLFSLLSDLLGLQRLSSEKTGVLRVLHERQEPPGVKGGVCITIAVTGKVVYGMVGLDHALSMLFDGLYKVSERI